MVARAGYARRYAAKTGDEDAMLNPVHHDSSRPQAAFVALFDVLGFKNRIETTPLDAVVDGYQRLRALKLRARSVPIMSSVRVRMESVGTTIFSDTILLWCDDESDAVQSLLTACAVLVASAIEERWPLRGGIAYGDCILNREARTFVGLPIVQAYQVEQSQEWLGAAIHETALNHKTLGTLIQRTEDVIKYAIPVKPKAQTLDYAIHWGPYAMGVKTILESLIEETEDLSVRAKYEATLGYLLSKCSDCHAWT